jgi:hypothetical protein
MFKWLNKQGVESSDGFVVQFTGRFTCEYREGNKTLAFEVEDGFEGAKPCVVVSSREFNQWNGEVLSNERKQQIIDNVRAAMNFQGLDLVVD